MAFIYFVIAFILIILGKLSEKHSPSRANLIWTIFILYILIGAITSIWLEVLNTK